MAKIQCFIVVPTGQDFRSLRRYVSESKCPAGPSADHPPRPLGVPNPVGAGYHNAHVPIEDGPARTECEHMDHSDPRWPKACACGYVFQEADNWQVFAERVYVREETGERFSLRCLPAGAMYYAPWLTCYAKGPDGQCLVVQTPGGLWVVDSRASNCTLPEDKEHRCWIRHGVPPAITVDKNGLTCGAGAGSIQAGSYHGFLRDGYLVD